MRRSNLGQNSVTRMITAIFVLAILSGNAMTQSSFCSTCRCLMVHAHISINANQTIDANTFYPGNTYWTLANGQYSPTTNASGLNCSSVNNPNPQPSWTIYTTNCPPNSTCVEETDVQIRVVFRDMKPACVLSCCPSNSFGGVIILEAIDDNSVPTSSTSWRRAVCRVNASE